MAAQSEETRSAETIVIPVTTIYKPIYANDFYKLPKEPIEYFGDLGIHIGRCLGEGTFAAAYEGRYVKEAKLPDGKEKFLGMDFAVKVHHIGYHPYVPGVPNKDKIDPETQNEINFANREDIIHPNIVEFHFTAQYPPQPKTVCDHVFIFMQKALFPLQDLLNVLIRQRARVPINVGIRWIRGIGSGLQHLHSIGVVHGDLHTYNMFVFGEPQPQVGNDFKFRNIDVKIADFGKCSDISHDSPEGKATKIQKDIERACLLFISLCDRISFPEEVRKQAVDHLNQCYQQKISFDEMLQSFVVSEDVIHWNLFIAP